jgi:octaprenyl-diphosphate synthase
MERDPELAPLLERSCAADDHPHDQPPEVDPDLAAHVARAMGGAGVTEDCLALATKLCREAVRAIAVLPPSRARSALESVALAVPRRRK